MPPATITTLRQNHKPQDTDIRWMHRALTLAHLGIPRAMPNPYTGALIVCNGHLVSEGYHTQPGAPHAEALAIQRAHQRGADLTQCTLYVNLEPCSHQGRTPPCTLAIRESGIPRVVYSLDDPNPRVHGKTQLKQWGITVQTGILHNESWWLNRRFWVFHQQQRPYIILKWAEAPSAIVGTATRPLPITPSFQPVLHWWRQCEGAILIGYQTALTDNPRLTVRYPPLWRQPLRILLDPNGQLPLTLNLFRSHSPLLIVTGNPQARYPLGEVLYLPDIHRPLYKSAPRWLPKLLEYLHQREILSILVEGGPSTHNLFLQNDLWDELRILQGSIPSGTNTPRQAPPLPATAHLLAHTTCLNTHVWLYIHRRWRTFVPKQRFSDQTLFLPGTFPFLP